jgi:hypothetical protein
MGLQIGLDGTMWASGSYTRGLGKKIKRRGIHYLGGSFASMAANLTLNSSAIKILSLGPLPYMWLSQLQ